MKCEIWLAILFIIGLTNTSNSNHLFKPDQNPVNEILIIQNVHVIDMDANELLEKRDIKILDGKIVQISQNVEVPNEAETIDLTGHYVIPALFDMHAHINTQIPWHEYHLALYRYFGVHHVNFMVGTDRLKELKEKSEARYDKFLTPKIYLASELIDGDPPLWGDQHNGPVITDRTDVEESLAALKEKGYSDIKVYNQLSEEVYLEILDVAEKLDLNVVGHVPFNLSVERRLDERHQRIEHVEGYLDLAYGGNPDTLPPGYARTPLLLDGYNRSKMREAAQLTAERDIWNTPTHVLFTSLIDSGYTDEMIDGKVSELVDPQTEKIWSQVVNNENQMPHLRSIDYRNTQLEMIRILHNEGAKLLAGTDAPQPVLLYGHSLHKELQYFVEAGMTPFEALKTATVNPAEYLGLDEYGKLSEGYQAEMIILKENPLNDITKTLAIEGYVSGHQYLSEKEMKSSLSSIKGSIKTH